MNPELALPTGASFHRGKSKQDYQTRQDFREAVVKKFGMPDFDLAASATNFFAKREYEYFGVGCNSLEQDWTELVGQLWLNPPFGDITPWAKKCWESAKSGRKILFLVPASVGSNWFQNYVHNCAMIYLLNPRLCFDGKNPYPKDMLLASYNDLTNLGVCNYAAWRWK